LISKYKISGKRVLLHVTQYFSTQKDFKGSKYIIDLARMFVGTDIVIVVVGRNTVKNLPPNIISIGQTNNSDTLSKFYSMAEITILTSKRETFSMVTAESLMCGTPVVGFKAGAPEVIAISEYSAFVDYADIQNLYKTIQIFLNRDFNHSVIQKEAKSKYSIGTMRKKYIKEYNNLVLK